MIRAKAKALAASALVIGLAGTAFAQVLPPMSGRYDLSQLPETKGVVRQYTLTPRGDVDGLILQDGTEVRFAPHLGVQVVYAIKPNDAISVRGLKARATPMIDAAQLRNDASGATIVDDGPGPLPDAQIVTISGRVSQPLHGKRGEVNGALLDDGTIIRMPPDQAASRSDLLAQGSAITVSGMLMQTPLGKVMDVTSAGASPAAMSAIDRPPPKGPKGKKG